MKYTHLLFWVTDNTLSVKFYKKLGFEIVKSDDEASIVKLDNLKIELVTMRDESEFARDSMISDRGRGMYIYIKSDDVDKEFIRLSKLRAEIKDRPRDWPWGRREFVVKDPDGYKFCIWQPVN
jgi:catechol 2,3-dioxygenase-like lactoylglutathione lyase family enzyme